MALKAPNAPQPADRPAHVGRALRLGVRPSSWPWPLPALAVWALGWLGVPWLGAPGACALGVLAALGWPGLSRWRRLLMGLGLPLSALALGWAAGTPAWWWLLPLSVLLLAYPLKAWRDAPLFPTPRAALDGLAERVPLAPGARVLDAGCGLGHGLAALHAQWPQAELHGVEWSRPLAWAARWRCRFARVRRGDLWADDWRVCQVVYVFQRPESMARVWAKASAEMAPGSWLVSLDFAVPDVAPQDVLHRPGRQPVWLYRLAPPQSATPGADNPRRSPGQRARA